MMIQMTIDPQQVYLNEESAVNLFIKNTGSVLCTSLHLKFKFSSPNIRLKGSRELHIPLLERNQVYTYKLELEALRLGAFQLTPIYCSCRSNGRTHRPELSPLTLNVVESPASSLSDQQEPPSSVHQRKNTDKTVATSTPNPEERRTLKADQSRKNLLTLRDALVSLYPDSPSIRRIADDAGMDQGRIDFNTNAINSWHAVLTEAIKIGQIDALLDVVESQYGANEEFRTVCDVFRQSLR